MITRSFRLRGRLLLGFLLFVAACRDPGMRDANAPGIAPPATATALVIPTASALAPVPDGGGLPPEAEARWVSGVVVPENPKREKSVAAFCASYVAEFKAALAALQSSLPRKTPSCREVKLPVAYQRPPGAPEVFAVALEEGLASYSRLLVALQDGIATTPVEWAVDLRHASSSPQHGETFDELRFEDGRLIAVVGRAQGFQFDDGAPAFALRRGVVACALVPKYVCHTYYPDEAQKDLFLGLKVRPWDAVSIPWSTLPWKGAKRFELDAERLRIVP